MQWNKSELVIQAKGEILLKSDFSSHARAVFLDTLKDVHEALAQYPVNEVSYRPCWRTKGCTLILFSIILGWGDFKSKKSGHARFQVEKMGSGEVPSRKNGIGRDFKSKKSGRAKFQVEKMGSGEISSRKNQVGRDFESKKACHRRSGSFQADKITSGAISNRKKRVGAISSRENGPRDDFKQTKCCSGRFQTDKMVPGMISNRQNRVRDDFKQKKWRQERFQTEKN